MKKKLDRDLVEMTELLAYFINKIDGVKDFNPLIYPQRYERSKELINKVAKRMRQI